MSSFKACSAIVAFFSTATPALSDPGLICAPENFTLPEITVVQERALRNSLPDHAAIVASIRFENTPRGPKAMVPMALAPNGPDRVIQIPENFYSLLCTYIIVGRLGTFPETNEVSDEGLFHAELEEKIWTPSRNSFAECGRVHRKPAEQCVREYLFSLNTRIGVYLRDADARVGPHLLDGLDVKIFETSQLLVFHEIGHHALRHFQRISDGEISISQAELEADQYALQLQVVNGQSVSGVYEFFMGQSLYQNASGLPENYIIPFNIPAGYAYEPSFCRGLRAKYTWLQIGYASTFIYVGANFGVHHLNSQTPEAIDTYIELLQTSENSWWLEGLTDCPEQDFAASEGLRSGLIKVLLLIREHHELVFPVNSEGNTYEPFQDGSGALLDSFANSLSHEDQLSPYRAQLLWVFLNRYLRRDTQVVSNDVSDESFIRYVRLVEKYGLIGAQIQAEDLLRMIGELHQDGR